MCRTPYCYGDCDECLGEEKERKEFEEFSAECPRRKECKLQYVNPKADQCKHCGQIFNY